MRIKRKSAHIFDGMKQEEEEKNIPGIAFLVRGCRGHTKKIQRVQGSQFGFLCHRDQQRCDGFGTSDVKVDF